MSHLKGEIIIFKVVLTVAFFPLLLWEWWFGLGTIMAFGFANQGSSMGGEDILMIIGLLALVILPLILYIWLWRKVLRLKVKTK